jgi:hypothetical protein
MKQLLIFALLTFSSAALADTFSDAKIDSVKLDKNKMNIDLFVELGEPCDQIALPQVIQDEHNPTVFKIQAQVREPSSGECIEMISHKHKIVSLPALLEASSAKLQKLATYTFRFEGTDTVIYVPGDSLMTSIQPDFQTE